MRRGLVLSCGRDAARSGGGASRKPRVARDRAPTDRRRAPRTHDLEATHVIGLDGLAETRAILDNADAMYPGLDGRGATPLVAIGGINAANAAACVAPLRPTLPQLPPGDGDGDSVRVGVSVGVAPRRRRLADGVAVVSAILGADDPRAAAAELSDAIATAQTPDDDPAGGG